MTLTPADATPLQVLQTVFGYDSWRAPQDEIIGTVIAGEDALVLMPTGGGKSLCYQIPAIIRPGTGIVVSPLISLMKDQVDALRSAGVRAAHYSSSLNAEESRQVLRDLHDGELDLLYVSPERALLGSFQQRLRSIDISVLAIDEAHCCSQWGPDFRPEYAKLASLRRRLPTVPTIALTATADPHTREDIASLLEIGRGRRFVASFDRPNIRYRVAMKQNAGAQLKRFLDARPDGESGIVYCRTRKTVESVADRLNKQGYRAAAYHAGLAPRMRTKTQEDFLRDEVDIVVATVAFGMGIDKPNVRFVVHYDVPQSVEAYYQETGRAGRDGLPSEALLLFGAGDVSSVRYLISRSSNEEQIRIEGHKLQQMAAFAQSLTCRRRALLEYFGERRDHDCGNCDICLDPPDMYDATVDAQKVLSCIYRLDQGYGANYVVDVLMGANTERIRSRNHDKLSTWGIGKDEKRFHWEGLLLQLIHRGVIVQDVARFSTLRLTERARPILRGEEGLELARPRVPEKKPATTRSSRRRRSTAVPDEHAELFDALRSLRTRLASAADVPPYIIFNDATLLDMCAKTPISGEQMLRVSGVGRAKLEKYGESFLLVIARHLEES